jgi:hypothetical protein
VGEAVIQGHWGGPLVALVGNPNCGKTALFHLLTGSRQKVANHAGVTVERKEGKLVTPAGETWRVLDLPGADSLHCVVALNMTDMAARHGLSPLRCFSAAASPPCSVAEASASIAALLRPPAPQSSAGA